MNNANSRSCRLKDGDVTDEFIHHWTLDYWSCSIGFSLLANRLSRHSRVASRG